MVISNAVNYGVLHSLFASGSTTWVALARHDSCRPISGPSPAQESAQLLSTAEMPTSVLKALLTNTKVGKCVTLVNLSPSDTWMEKCCLRWHIDHGDREFPCLILSTDLPLASYSEKIVAMPLQHSCSGHSWLRVCAQT